MKKVIPIVLLICIVSSFISCTKTEANEVSKISISDALIEKNVDKTTSGSITLEEVEDIIDKAREVYKRYGIVDMGPSGSISTVDVSDITIENVKQLTPENYKSAYETYIQYVDDVQEIALEMIKSTLDENAVFEIEQPVHVNADLPDAYIALDLEGSGCDHVIDVITKVRNNELNHAGQYIMVNGSEMITGDPVTNEIVCFFPGPEEQAILNEFKAISDYANSAEYSAEMLKKVKDDVK